MEKRKVLLHINTTLNSGSTGRIAEQISTLAERDGWECYIAHGARYINTSSFKSIQIGTKIGNYFHAFIGEYMGLHGFGSILATFFFLRKVDKIKPDIIHLHNIHGYYINIELLFKYVANNKIPVVWTLHDCWSFTGHCTHFEFAGCNKWKRECGDCSLLMAQYKSRIFDRSKLNYQRKRILYSMVNDMTIVPVSNWLANLVSESMLRRFPVEMITNGIDLEIFKPRINNVRQSLNISDSQKIILGVVASGFVKEKGSREFLELSKFNRFSIIIVGLSKNEIRKMPNSIICIERTGSQEELAEYYSAADVFVNPTYNETLGLTNIESMACGTPVVTYNAGGSPETIDTKTGIVVEKGNFKAMLTAIDEILDKGKACYTTACIARAKNLYNKKDRYNSYINLYNRILAHK